MMHDKLLPYVDVIVFSIKGKRSLASKLSVSIYPNYNLNI